MKKIGWILIVFGTLAFIGAASKGNSVFGPLFWMALGGCLIYIKREREAEPKDLQNKDEQKPDKTPMVEKVELKAISKEMETSTKQKEAALCLVAFFAGYNDDLMTNEAVSMIICQASIYFGISNYKETLAAAMSQFNDADKLIDTVLGIKDKETKEFLLLSCYDLTTMSGKDEAYEMLFYIANDMGYYKDKFNQLVNQYSSSPIIT